MSYTAGKRLTEARIARGLTHEDVTKVIKIRATLLRALEDDDYTQFPSITHARNFLSLYARHLDLDLKEDLANLATPTRISVENYQYLNNDHHDERDFRTVRRRRSSSGQPRELTFKSIVGFLLVVVLVLIIGYLAINLKRLNLGPASTTKETTVAPPPLPAPTPAPAPSPTPLPTPDAAPYRTPLNDHRRIIDEPTRPPF